MLTNCGSKKLHLQALFLDFTCFKMSSLEIGSFNYTGIFLNVA